MSDTRKPAVLHVIPNIERGGAERVLVSLSHGLLELGYSVRILVLGWKNSFVGEIKPDIPVLLLGYPLTYRRVLATLRCLLQLRRILVDTHPALVHSHLWPAARMVGWARRGCPIPHIVHIHAPIAWLEQGDFRSKSMRYLTRCALSTPRTYYIASGSSVLEYTRRHLTWIPRDTPTVYNGFDRSTFSRFRVFQPRGQREMVTFGLACRLVPGKGIDRCLKAFKLVNVSRRWRCVIAGEGSEKSRLETLAQTLGLGKNVEFVGSVSDMGSFYDKLDVFVQASLSEGLSLATIEAMACGLPVVATDVGATRELVRDGIDGVLVPADDIPALARALSRIADHGDLRRTMAAAAHERAWSEFSSTRMVERIVNIYETVMLSEKTCLTQNGFGTGHDRSISL